MRTFALAIAFLVAGFGYAVACQFDVDCGPGATCKKSPTEFYGACVGGVSPGNRNDDRPRPKPNSQDKFGDRCQSDAQCGGLYRCDKNPEDVYGACR